MWKLIVVTAFISTCTAVADEIVVTTQNGRVRGQMKQYTGGDVYQFLGIPYATPPIGQLRFKKPQSNANWTGIHDATQFGPSCMQDLFDNDKWLLPNTNISEDCLHLNVYIPHSINVTEAKAVMVWIHGGGFYAGQGMLIDGSYLALQGNVIVVTINYRLGLFGFLSTGDESAAGNYGLWDQQLAIKWVKNNIDNFGGNSSNICIFGESAGGYSVGLHTVSPLNKGLFQRAISESGAVYSPRAIATNSPVVARKAATLLNCPIDTTDALVNCLRSRSGVELLRIQSKSTARDDLMGEMSFENRLGPVIDNDLVVGSPIDILKDTHSDAYKIFRALDIIVGTNNAEGGLLYFKIIGYQTKFNFNILEGVPAEVVCDVIAPAVARDYYDSDLRIRDAVCDQYTVANASLDEQGRAALNIYADVQFIIPTVITARVHSSIDASISDIGSTYHYIFTHQPNYPWIQDRPPWLKGANHAGELPFVFGLDAMYPLTANKDEDEKELSKDVMTLWSNFAKTGNPNSPSSAAPQWPQFDMNTQAYMNLTESPHNGSWLFEDRTSFWTEKVPIIVDQDKPQTISGKPHTTPGKPQTTNGKPQTTRSKQQTTPGKPRQTTPVKPQTTPSTSPQTTPRKPQTTPSTPSQTTPGKPQTTPSTSPQTTPGKPQTNPSTPPQTTPDKPHTTPSTAPQTTPGKPQTTPGKPQTTPSTEPQTTPGKPQTNPSTPPQTTPGKPQTTPSTAPQTTPGKPQTNPSTPPQTTPGKPQTTPGKPQTTHSTAPQTTPGKSQTNPSTAPQPTPGKPQTNPSTAPQPTPGKPQTNPSTAPQPTPGKPQTNPSTAPQTTPGKPQTNPSTAPQTTSGNPQTTPGNPQITPDNPQTTPGKPQTTPGKPQTTPSTPLQTCTNKCKPPQTITSTPSQTTQGKPQTTPGKPQTTPGKPQTTPSTPLQTTPGKPPQTITSTPLQTTPGKPQTTPGKPQTTSSTPLQTTPSTPLQTTPSTAPQTTPGKRQTTPSTPSQTTPGKPQTTPSTPLQKTTPGKPQTTQGQPLTTPGNPQATPKSNASNSGCKLNAASLYVTCISLLPLWLLF